MRNYNFICYLLLLKNKKKCRQKHIELCKHISYYFKKELGLYGIYRLDNNLLKSPYIVFIVIP